MYTNLAICTRFYAFFTSGTLRSEPACSLVNDVEYVEAKKVHFVHKIPILDLKEKNKEICISDGKSGNQETPQKTGRREKETIASKPVMFCFRL